MTYRLFVTIGNRSIEKEFITVTNLEDAQETVEVLGFPSYVSFAADADFSLEFMYWLLRIDVAADYWMPPERFEWFVSSNHPFNDLINETFKAYKKDKFKYY